MVYKKGSASVGQGGLARETLDDVPEAMQSLPQIPCLPSPLFLSVYSFFFSPNTLL